MNTKKTIALKLFRIFVTSGKRLSLAVSCGVLLGGALFAQDSQAIQPPQEPPQQATPQSHLRQGQPGVYQSFRPCRLVDTRTSDGPFGGPKLVAGGTRSFSLVPSGGACGDTLPAGATALAINVTITQAETSFGFPTIWPTGQPQPNASAINWTSPGTTVANAVIVPVGAGGSIDIFSQQATHVILDVSGYFLNSLEPGDQLSIVANNNSAAVVGQNNGTGAGVYGQSAGGPAGQFAGHVEVAGNVRVSGAGNGIVFPDGTTQTTAGGGGGGGGVGGTGTANAVPLWTNGTTLGSSAIRQAGGNVGIGTASPVTALDVRGSLTLEAGGSPTLYTAAGGGEQNRYLHLINSPASPSASGLKAGGLLVSDDYFFANPGKNDLIVKGTVNYGQLTKLDVANNFAATVRAADFLLGHSSRRGTPGRAFVDGGNRLVVNFNRDWARTDVESDLIVHGLAPNQFLLNNPLSGKH